MRLPHAVLSITALFGLSSAPAALGDNQDALQALHFLAKVNTPSPLQPASCHGSIGTDIGAGVDTYAMPNTNAVLASQLGTQSAADKDAGNSSSAYSSPRLWLTKGLPIPVDLSMSVAAPSSGGGINQVSGYLQWTLYQALARPALGVRASYGRLYAQSGTSLTSAGAEVVASYGLLRYFTFYARAGANQTQGSLTITPNTAVGYALKDPGPTTITAHWLQPERAVGLRLTLWSPLLAITGEADFSYGQKADYAAKLSYML